MTIRAPRTRALLASSAVLALATGAVIDLTASGVATAATVPCVPSVPEVPTTIPTTVPTVPGLPSVPVTVPTLPVATAAAAVPSGVLPTLPVSIPTTVPTSVPTLPVGGVCPTTPGTGTGGTGGSGTGTGGTGGSGPGSSSSTGPGTGGATTGTGGTGGTSPTSAATTSACVAKGASVALDGGAIHKGQRKGLTARCLKQGRKVKVFSVTGGRTALVKVVLVNKYGTVRFFYKPLAKGKLVLSFSGADFNGKVLRKKFTTSVK